MIRKFFATILICLLAAGCSTTTPEPTDDSVGILMFGDSGYHLNYPSRRDYADLYSVEEFEKDEWNSWLKDKRPEEEFEVKPTAISPVTGKVVDATGLHQISTAMRDYCANYATCDLGVMVGDNIYPNGATLGADDVEDAQRFKDILGDPFGEIVAEPSDYVTYVTLGNHDWGTSREGGFFEPRRWPYCNQRPPSLIRLRPVNGWQSSAIDRPWAYNVTATRATRAVPAHAATAVVLPATA